MKFICEKRDDKIWVRAPCCINRETGELREDYSGWIIKDLDVPTPNILCNDEGRLIWKVVGNKVMPGVSPLTEKEQAAKDKPSLEEEIAALKLRIEQLEKTP